MNAAVALLHHILPATVHLEAEIAREHPSASILGTDRMGTGVVVDPAGLILTVNYIVLGAREVHVTLVNGETFVGEVVKHDFTSGLALVRIPQGGLVAAALRRSAQTQLGDEAFVVASVGRKEGLRVATGGVSYLGPFDANWEYVLDRAIMTTAMNPGLGGGPLVDAHGGVIGIVSLNLSEVGRFSLAVPSEHYLDARDAFNASGSIALRTRAWLGLFCYVMNNHVVVAGLLPGGPSELAGIKTGDVILSIDGQDVGDRASLYRRVWTRRPGDSLTLRIFRGRETRTITLAVGDVAEFFA